MYAYEDSCRDMSLRALCIFKIRTKNRVSFRHDRHLSIIHCMHSCNGSVGNSITSNCMDDLRSLSVNPVEYRWFVSSLSVLSCNYNLKLIVHEKQNLASETMDICPLKAFILAKIIAKCFRNIVFYAEVSCIMEVG